MDKNDYLKKVLAGQDMEDDSQELEDLEEHREDVETLLRTSFPDTGLTIKYGGSKAKGTLNLEAYDLDLACYVTHGDDTAGTSLKDIYDNFATKLEGSYRIERKTSAIRLRSKEADTYNQDFHIDVVPGRFVDDSKGDCFLHQEGNDKDRLKTNLKVHIDHVRNSGVVPAIRLQKLWRVRKALPVKQFAFELLVIKLLKGKSGKSLADQLTHVWEQLRDSQDPISVEDPANPSGNDLTPLLADAWTLLQSEARTTLVKIEALGWESVFGPLPAEDDDESKTAKLRRAAAAVTVPTRPWLSKK